MRVSGEAVLHAPPEQVWAALTDPEVLARTIPGCERLEPNGPGSCRVTATTGLASARGTYAGEVRLLDQEPPTSLLIKADGAGGQGTVSATVRVRLAGTGNGSTGLAYEAGAEVAGLIAGVGQQLLASVAKRIAAEFFTALDQALTKETEMAGTATQERRRPAVSSPTPATTPGASGMTSEPPTVHSQPAGRPGAAAPEHRSATPARRHGFPAGMLAGAAVTLAGVAVASIIRRRRDR